MRLAVTALLLAAFSVHADPKSEAKEYTSKEGRFKAVFSEEPKENANTIKTAAGELKIITTYVSTNDGIRAVAYFDVPADSVKGVKPDDLLDRARDGAINNVKGKLGSEKKLMLDKTHPGREFDAELPTGGVFRCRVYLVKDRVYQILLGGSKDAVNGKDADQFLDSFQLIK